MLVSFIQFAGGQSSTEYSECEKCRDSATSAGRIKQEERPRILELRENAEI